MPNIISCTKSSYFTSRATIRENVIYGINLSKIHQNTVIKITIKKKKENIIWDKWQADYKGSLLKCLAVFSVE
jgi:hypothetical protein